MLAKFELFVFVELLFLIFLGRGSWREEGGGAVYQTTFTDVI